MSALSHSAEYRCVSLCYIHESLPHSVVKKTNAAFPPLRRPAYAPTGYPLVVARTRVSTASIGREATAKHLTRALILPPSPTLSAHHFIPDRCLFAHGDYERRMDDSDDVPSTSTDVNPRYKTRLCRWWTENGSGSCPHGA